jgi:hypothetical protein
LFLHNNQEGYIPQDHIISQGLQPCESTNHSISGDESMQVYDTYYHTYRLKDLEINSNVSVHKGLDVKTSEM